MALTFVPILLITTVAAIGRPTTRRKAIILSGVVWAKPNVDLIEAVAEVVTAVDSDHAVEMIAN
eukprot:2955066-Pyramimonas_sp.AAC.1